MKLRRLEGAPAVSAHALQAQAQALGEDPNVYTAASNEAPAKGVQTSGWMTPITHDVFEK
jgi:hypothetical protein